MSKKSILSSFAFLGFLWLVSLAFLGFSLKAPLEWVAFIVLGLTSFFFIGYLYQVINQQGRIENEINLHHVFSSTLSEFEEVSIFDEQGRTVLTTHPHLYPHQKEFLRKTLMKISSSAEAKRFKKWVEEQHSGEVLLSGGGDGLGQQKTRWLARTQTVDPTLVHGKNMVLVSIINLTKYLDSFHQLKESYKHLEGFLDKAPFGFFYVNTTRHFIGVNQTLCHWFNHDKDNLVGKKVKDFIPDFKIFQDDERVRVITVHPDENRSFKALYFPPSRHSKNKASILCRLDDSIISTASSTNDFINEISFLKSKIPSVILNRQGSIVSMNPAFSSVITETIMIDNHVQDIQFYDLLEARTQVEAQLEKHFKGYDKTGTLEVVFKDKKYHATAHVSVLDDPFNSKTEPKMLLQFIDISEQKRLEEQFSQSQKMQAVGQLAGGIAHDFNNLLTAIIGYSDLLLNRHLPNDPSYKDVIQVKQNAERAANLVRQLLAFSRQQSLQPKVIDVTEILSELSALLRRLIGVNVELNLIHGRDLYTIKADVSQLEQVIINMVVNARDAMKDKGGILTIKTYNFSCQKKVRIDHDMMPKGEYAVIEISDVGTGIEPHHLERIFEPFFSTKEIGQGTGLGLSTVYGIVKQSNGFIEVQSTLNVGTKFKIYFPQHIGAEKKIEEPKVKPEDLSGGGTILLVEDEDAVRMFSVRALKEKGYNVLEAENGDVAFKMVQNGEKFDLLVTDVVMPKMDGPTLNKKIRDILPNIKTIFISGYAEDTFRKNLGDNEQIHFLPKPFSLKDLASKVKDVLNG